MLIESNTQKFLAFIFKYPTTGFSIREVAEEINISPPTASYIAKKLARMALIKLQRERTQYKVFGNIENEKFKDIKRIFNIFSLLSLKDFLVKELNPNTIVVYGSYSIGEDTEDSDIDLFVNSAKRKNTDLTKFERQLARNIHIIVERFDRLPDELKSSILNGVILYGVIGL